MATKVRNEVPAAVVVHCFGHYLNLCLQSAGRKLDFLCDSLNMVKEIAKLIKFSPKRSHLLQKLGTADCDGVSIKKKPFVPHTGQLELRQFRLF